MSLEHQAPNEGAPYPNSSPYPPDESIFPPCIGFNIGSPLYMPQPYAGLERPSSPGSPFHVTSHHTSSERSPYHVPYRTSGGSHYYANSGRSPHHLSSDRLSYGIFSKSGQASLDVSPYHKSSRRSSCPASGRIPSPYSHSPPPYSPSPPPYSGAPSSSNPENHGSSTSGYVSATDSPSHHAQDGHFTMPKKSPTVVAIRPFNPLDDAEVLRKAMKGFGADEKTIISVLTRCSNAQRLKIAVQFKTLYGRDLTKKLKSELNGCLKDLIVALMTPLPQFYAKELYEAINGFGTDEHVLIEVMCTLSNAQIRTIREAYYLTFHQNLEKDVKDDTSGHFKRLMVSLCNAARDESMKIDPEAAVADARTLLRAGELRLGTDESIFNMILCQRNYAQLRLIFKEYEHFTGHDIEKAIKNEFSGDIKDGLLGVVRSIKNKTAFFAKRLNKSLKGLGTCYKDLIRVIVTRCEVDMGDIKREYATMYGESLADAIRAECSGNYKMCLLTLIGET